MKFLQSMSMWSENSVCKIIHLSNLLDCINLNRQTIWLKIDGLVLRWKAKRREKDQNLWLVQFTMEKLKELKEKFLQKVSTSILRRIKPVNSIGLYMFSSHDDWSIDFHLFPICSKPIFSSVKPSLTTLSLALYTILGSQEY